MSVLADASGDPLLLSLVLAAVCIAFSVWLCSPARRQPRSIVAAVLPPMATATVSRQPPAVPVSIGTGAVNALPPLVTTTRTSAEKSTGLLTPPITPIEQDPYLALLTLMAPGEMDGAPAELLQEVLFADMEAELLEMMAEDGGGPFASPSSSSPSVSSSFVSVSSDFSFASVSAASEQD